MERPRPILLLAVLGVVVASVFGVLATFIVKTMTPVSEPTAPPPSFNQTHTPAPSVIGFGLPLVDLNGLWEYKKNESRFVALVKDNKISIDMENGQTSMRYWMGTFKGSETAGAMITSEALDGDVAVMSQAEAKNFYITETAITFGFTAMGKTVSIEMTRSA